MSGNTTDQPEDAIAKATSLADSLSPDKAAHLLAGLPQDGTAEGKVAPIRRALVDRLNRLRPQRARRLFTSLVEAMLVGETLGSEDQAHVAYAFSRADIGGIWQALARRAFPDLALEISQTLDRLCQNQLIDAAMAEPAAVAVRERLRLATIENLGRVLADRNLGEKFLEAANHLRDREHARIAPIDAGPLPPMGLGLLADFVEALMAAPILTPALARYLPRLKTTADSEIFGAALVAGTSEIDGALRAAGLPPGAAEALPLAALNRLSAYAGVAAYLRRRGERGNGRVGGALVAHFANHLRAFAQTLAVAAPIERREDLPLSLGNAVRTRLTSLTQHLEAEIGAIRRAGLADAPALMPVLRDAVMDTAAALARTAFERIAHRFSAALNHRHDGAIDDDDVRLVVTLVTRLRAALLPTGLPIGQFTTWRDRAVSDIEFAIHRATRLDGEADDDLAGRFAHLERIEDLAQAVGRSIAADLQPTSRHTQAIMAARLEDPTPLSPAGARMCAGFATAIRGEIAKVRYWRNPEMVALAERAAARGL
jgi:hypothetical protein